MIETLQVEGFTVLPRTTFAFGRGLNVLIGDNGTGKTHWLKLLWALAATAQAVGRQRTKNGTEAFCRRLRSTFQTSRLSSLAARGGKTPVRGVLTWSDGGRMNFCGEGEAWQAECDGGKEAPKVLYLPPQAFAAGVPRLTKWIESGESPWDAACLDACEQMVLPEKRRLLKADQRLAETLEAVLGGKAYVDEATGRLGVLLSGEPRDAGLLGEGELKLLQLSRLVRAGAVPRGSVLCWDMPEAGVNPRTLQTMAQWLWRLSLEGRQVFVATHSVYLLREWHLLQKAAERSAPEIRWFGLLGEGRAAQVAEDLWELETFTAFDAEAEQNVRFLQAEG